MRSTDELVVAAFVGRYSNANKIMIVRSICLHTYTSLSFFKSIDCPTEVSYHKKTAVKKTAVSGESAGVRTRDPNIKSVVLYLLSYGFSEVPMLSRLVVQR